MIVYGLYWCTRWEHPDLNSIYETEEAAVRATEEMLSRWDGRTRWGRIKNQEDGLGPCLRAVRVRENPLRYDSVGDLKVGYVYQWMVVIAPVEVRK